MAPVRNAAVMNVVRLSTTRTPSATLERLMVATYMNDREIRLIVNSEVTTIDLSP
jgi:hypothetical protein